MNNKKFNWATNNCLINSHLINNSSLREQKHLCVKVRCIEDNLIFSSVSQCAIHYNVSGTIISIAINQNKKINKINKTFERVLL